jgi:DNA-binding Lrp family transcriptional regulator
VIDSFQATIRALPEVVSVYYLAGATDFLIHVAVRDSEHLRDFALDAITSRPEVARVETALIFDHVRSPTLPDYAATAR